MNIKLTRQKLEQLTEKLIERSLEPCRKALKDANLTAGQIDEVILVGGQTRMPAVVEAVKKMFGKEPRKDVNPDEAVAIGAAVQGGILRGDVKDILLLDVTPLSLGIETMGGIATKLITRNTTIPTTKSQVFSTAADSQPSVEVHVVQGEREMASDNKSLGKFILDGIPPAPRGVPQIEVTFDIDANGILHVKAKDKGTGKEQKITIQGTSGLTEAEIQKMQQDAELYAEEDKKKRELITTKNEADSLVYSTEKTIKEHESKIEPGDKTAMTEKLESLKSEIAKETLDIDALKKAMEELNTVAQAAFTKLYQQNAAASDDGTTVKDGNEKSGPVEGEVVDEKK